MPGLSTAHNSGVSPSWNALAGYMHACTRAPQQRVGNGGGWEERGTGVLAPRHPEASALRAAPLASAAGEQHCCRTGPTAKSPATRPQPPCLTLKNFVMRSLPPPISSSSPYSSTSHVWSRPVHNYTGLHMPRQQLTQSSSLRHRQQWGRCEAAAGAALDLTPCTGGWAGSKQGGREPKSACWLLTHALKGFIECHAVAILLRVD